MKLSVVIPAHNERDCICGTLLNLYRTLRREEIEHELLVVNDHSLDGTPEAVDSMLDDIPTLLRVDNLSPNGFGFAVRCGLEKASGDYIAIMMADASDDPEDLVGFFRKAVSSDSDAIFGNRFVKGGGVFDYPRFKFILNRFTNRLIAVLFWVRYTDITNAFKLYRRDALEGLKPYISNHFNLTVELPLKIIVRGYSYSILPNKWHNRKTGISKLKIKEMGSRYWFIILYCLIEKWLSVGDYRKKSMKNND